MSKIGVIGAMHLECELMREQLQSLETNQYLDIKIAHGRWAGHQVCLLESGIGKVNATLATEWLAREFEPDLIINTGSAGGIKAGTKVGDFVFATQVCHHDIDVSPIGFEFGELPSLPIYYPVKASWLALLDSVATAAKVTHYQGTLATGESFIYNNHQVELINQRFSQVLACEMEAAAVAQVCHLHGIEFLVLRNLSDVAGDDAPVNFNQYIAQAGRRSSDLVLQLIAAIN